MENTRCKTPHYVPIISPRIFLFSQLFSIPVCSQSLPVHKNEKRSFEFRPVHIKINLIWHIEGKRPLGRPRRRRVDNIKMYLREIRWDGRDWIDLAQDRDQWRAVVNAVINLGVP
jgi:hypothetical protein